MNAETLLRLYPRAWRERYADEFLDACGTGPLTMQQVIDIVGGAIDARVTPQSHLGTPQPEGASMPTLINKLHCTPAGAVYTTKDALKSAVFVVASSFVLTMIALWCRANGWTFANHFFKSFAFPASILLSSHFTFLKGQSVATKAVVSGGTLVLIALICAWSAAIANH